MSSNSTPSDHHHLLGLDAKPARAASSDVEARLADRLRVGGHVAAAQAADDRSLAAALHGSPLERPAADIASGRNQAALGALRAHLQTDPHSTPAAHLMGVAMARLGALAEAESLLAACARIDPAYTPARISYIEVLRGLRRFQPALAEIHALRPQAPDNLRLLWLEVDIQTDLGDFVAAARIVEELLVSFADEPALFTKYGQQLQVLGRLDDAAQAHRRALELDPDCAAAYCGLAALKRPSFSEEDVAQMQRLARSATTPPPVRGALHFALGQAMESRGEDEAAFQQFVEANAVMKPLRPYDPDFLEGVFAELKRRITPELMTARQRRAGAGPGPVFIVGLPRAGSTLVEQILGAHPAIEATRELDEIGRLVDRLSGPDPARYPLALSSARLDVLASIGQAYLEATRAYRRTDRARFTDKQPDNFIHAALIRLILPEAKIVDVRRHPLACCVSAFKEDFASGWGVTCDLTHLGRYYRAYVELMDHYDAVMPGAIHRVFYERLVEAPEAEARALFDYLELPFDPGSLRFFERAGAVATASSAQVRQPIHRRGLDDWRRYDPWLGPLKTALGSALAAYPFPTRAG